MPATQGSPAAAKIGWVAVAALMSVLALLWVARPAHSAVVAPVIDTTITDGPADSALIDGDTASFSFSATRDGAPFPGAIFRCSVDNAPDEPCASPMELVELEEGAHSFSVFAEDPEHFTADPEPARRSFIVATEEECEEVEDEDGLLEEGSGCEEEGSPLPPAECLLRTARARVFTYTEQNRIRLVIRYTSFSPADVTVDYRLTGGQGSLKLRKAKRRFAAKGLFRLDERLSGGEMQKVRAARSFTVIMHIAATPRYCRRYDTRHLTIRRTVHSQVVWFQSDSIFGTKP